MAYLDAFTKMVNADKTWSPNAKADNVSQAVTMAKPGKMYAASNLKSKVVRDLDPGMRCIPAVTRTAPGRGTWWRHRSGRR